MTNLLHTNIWTDILFLTIAIVGQISNLHLMFACYYWIRFKAKSLYTLIIKCRDNERI